MSGPQECLERPDGTGAQCTGTGIAVHPRHAEFLQGTRIDFARYESGEIGILKYARGKLHRFSYDSVFL